jgi:iron complex outermembrane recepter protein
MKTAIAFIIFFTSFAAGQQNDSLLYHKLGEIEVTAERSTGLNSVEVTSEDFSGRNMFTALDALQYSPGVYASVSGKNESQLSVRGYDQRQISVMIDGAPVYFPYDGGFDLGNVQLAGFNKISVIKNTPSILYGPNSMGGTINLVTSNPVKPLSAFLTYQNGSSQNASLGLNGITSGFIWNAALGLSESDGFNLPAGFSPAVNEDGDKRNNSSYNSKSGMIKIGSNLLNNTNLAFLYSYSSNEKDVPVNIYTTRPRFWKYSEWNKSLANLMFNSTVSSAFTLKGNIFYESFYNVLDSYDDAAYSAQTAKYAFHSTYDDYSYGINLLSYVSTDFLPLTKIIFLYKKDIHSEQGNYNLPFENYKAEIITFGAEEEFNISGNIKAAAGVSYDRMNPVFAGNSPLRSASDAFNGNLGLRFNLNENLNLYSNASRKTRFPTLKEFYSELLGSYKANPGLSPEQSNNFEIGAVTGYSGFTASAALFYSSVENLIQIVSLGDNVRQYQNVNKARLYGTEFELKKNLTFVNTAINYTFLSAENLTDNNRLPGRPGHIFNLLLNKNYNMGFEWYTEASYTANQYSLNSDSGELMRISDYFILNARIGQKILNNYTLFFRVNNILDKLYETEYGFPQPGRQFYAGISAEW